MFQIARGRYKATLIYDSSKQTNRYIVSLLESNLTVVSFEIDKFTGRASPVKTLLFENNMFYSGLSSVVRKMIRDMGDECEIHDLKSFYVPDKKKAIERVMNGLKYKMRDYQIEAVVKTIGKSQTLTSLPTGTGKSLVMGAMLLADDVEAVIVVDAKGLMYQLASAFREYTGIECGIVGDGQYYPKRWTVAVIDSLLSERGNDLIKSSRALYFDEAHKSGAPTYRTIVDVGKKNIIIRRGFSATTFRNDNRTYLLPALSGPVAIHYTTSHMVDEGWLAIPHIIMPKVNNFKTKATYYNAIYKSCIIGNKLRNGLGVEALVNAAKNGELAVGLFKNVKDHWPLIRDLLYKSFPKNKIAVVHGSLPGPSRERALAEFADGSKMILVASTGTTAEGIDLPGDVRVGVNFSGGCSELQIRQMLGRCLRKPKILGNEIDKNTPFHIRWHDFLDETDNEMNRQARIRFDIYNSERSFVIES